MIRWCNLNYIEQVFIHVDKYTWKLHIKNHPESFQILAKCQESLWMCLQSFLREDFLHAAAPFTLPLTLLTSPRLPACVSSPGNISPKVKNCNLKPNGWHWCEGNIKERYSLAVYMALHFLSEAAWQYSNLSYSSWHVGHIIIVVLRINEAVFHFVFTGHKTGWRGEWLWGNKYYVPRPGNTSE